jgi:hypothetical protein
VVPVRSGPLALVGAGASAGLLCHRPAVQRHPLERELHRVGRRKTAGFQPRRDHAPLSLAPLVLGPRRRARSVAQLSALQAGRRASCGPRSSKRASRKRSSRC